MYVRKAKTYKGMVYGHDHKPYPFMSAIGLWEQDMITVDDVKKRRSRTQCSRCGRVWNGALDTLPPHMCQSGLEEPNTGIQDVREHNEARYQEEVMPQIRTAAEEYRRRQEIMKEK